MPSPRPIRCFGRTLYLPRFAAMTLSARAPADPFTTLRPRLFGIAYRMLGVRADAEDVLQDLSLIHI